jgi:excisionase family DNA binding protein
MRPYVKHPGEIHGEPALVRLLQPTEPIVADDSRSIPTDATASSGAAPVDEVIDVAAVGKMLRIGRNKIYEMVARNEIPHRRFGRRIRFSRAAIMRWLDSWSSQVARERH